MPYSESANPSSRGPFLTSALASLQLVSYRVSDGFDSVPCTNVVDWYGESRGPSFLDGLASFYGLSVLCRIAEWTGIT